MRIWGAIVAALLVGVPALAGTGHILIGLDETSYFGPKGEDYRAQGADSVLVLDASDSAHPRITTRLPMINSVWGPPVNLQITPDGSLGLVAKGVTVFAKDGKWLPAPADTVHVIDMTSLRQIGDVKVGAMPQGIAISHDGRFALVANRSGHSVSLLRITGKSVVPVTQVAVGDEVSALAVTPDGRRAFIAKNLANTVGVLAIDGERLRYDPSMDIPSGFKPYNIAVTPDGAIALVANNGLPGNIAAFTVIAAKGPHPHVIQTVDVGDGPEGFAMAPDGSSAAIALLHGSFTAYNHWAHHANGGVVMLSIRDGKVRLLPGEVAVGGVPEGIAYSHDGRYVYVGDFNEKRLHVIAAGGQGLRDTGTVIALPGHPASMRGPAP